MLDISKLETYCYVSLHVNKVRFYRFGIGLCWTNAGLRESVFSVNHPLMCILKNRYKTHKCSFLFFESDTKQKTTKLYKRVRAAWILKGRNNKFHVEYTRGILLCPKG